MKWSRCAGGAGLALAGGFLCVQPLVSIAFLLAASAVAFAVRAKFAPSMRDYPWIAVWLAALLGLLGIQFANDVLPYSVAVVLAINAVLRLRERSWGIAGADVACGAVAATWPGSTVVALALAAAAWIVWTGLSLAVTSLAPEWDPPRAVRYVPSVVAVVLAGLLVTLTVYAKAAAPRPTSFYATPDQLPSATGVLLRAEQYTGSTPTGTQGWRILYSTVGIDGKVAAASALVLSPRQAGPQPVVAWAHPTTGINRGCAPSLTDDVQDYGEVPMTALRSGLAVVAPDYVGLGTQGPSPYFVGDAEARSLLDAVQAAHQLKGPNLSAKTVAWGHSQGGQAALWAGTLAPRYPDLKLLGVAGLAPAADLPRMFGEIRDDSAGVSLGAFTVSAYSNAYSDIRFEDYFRPILTRTMQGVADRCNLDPGLFVAQLGMDRLAGNIWKQSPDSGPLRARLQQNIPPASEVPVIIEQGLDDVIVPAHIQADYVDGKCIRYKTYRGLDHNTLVTDEAPVADLIAWTDALLAGQSMDC